MNSFGASQEKTLQTSRPRPAAYGAACITCSQAKCRCIRQVSGSKCERCQRLDKECRPGYGKRTVRGFATPKKAQLEEKIDGLVSLLTSASRHVETTADSAAQLGDGLTARNIALPAHSNIDSTSNTDGLAPTNFPHHITNGADLNTVISAEEQEECLLSFQTHKLMHFPFIFIHHTTSAQDLRTEKPFFWLCLMAVSTRSMSQQKFLCNLVRREIAERVLYSLEKSLDLLLGFLTCIVWGDFQVQRRPFMSLYTQLAVSMVFDLGLNKPPPKGADAMSDYRFHLSQVQYNRSMEDRRAVLACFVASSVVSLHQSRIDPLRWTAHMDECLETLAESPECTGDSLLALLVRVQLILEKVAQSPWHNGMSVEIAASVTTPAEFYVRALLAQLHEVKQKIPFELQKNDVLQLSLYHAELRIHDVALSPYVPTISASSNFGRIESLHTCLTAVNSWFEVFFSIAPDAYVGFTYAIFTQLSSSSVALYKLSVLEDEAWDRASVRRTADVLAIAERIARNLEQVAVLAGLGYDGGERDIFTRIAAKIRIIMPRWKEKLALDFTEFPVLPSQGVDVAHQLTDLTSYLLEDAWLANMLDPWV